MLPFTVEDLLGVFETYNLAIWPMQVVAYVLGVVAVLLVARKTAHSSRIIAGILSFLWLFSSGFFIFALVPIYKPAYVFGAAFVIQAAIFFACVIKPRLSFVFARDAYTVFGLLLIAFAMIGYPILGYFIGHRYPQSPPFGLTPCPLSVFTFGLLLLTDRRVPKWIIAIPFLYALGGIMPVSIGVTEDLAMLVAGVFGTAMILYRDAKRPEP
ncbi:MAG: DUF6064 family protein [Thermoanaerobaculales bacterium]|nr:DUF6064 family protein [Thermoanaerobaculales bacterium]